MPRPAGGSDSAPRAQTVYRLAAEHRFALIGIADARPSEHAAFLRDWLERGHHGEMDFMLEYLDERMDVTRLVPGARAVIALADVYACRETSPTNNAPPLEPQASSLTPSDGRIARYAHGDDYHWVMKRRMHRLADALREVFPGHEFRSCVDTAPTLDREHAQLAGLGWVGKNTMLIHPTLGSYLALGAIVTTLPLQTSVEAGEAHVAPGADHCGTCTRCIDACPTRCITPYHVDATRCVSYLTIEHRTLIDASLHGAMGQWLAGCDVCQEVCPFNEPGGAAAEGAPAVEAPMHPKYQPRPPAPALPLLEVLNWSAQDRQRAVSKSALKRIRLEQFKRNALIAAGNWLRGHEDQPLRRRVEQLASDESEHPLVRETARQVLERPTDR